MMKIKENKRLLLALSCIMVLVVIFSVIFYNFIIKKDIPQGGCCCYITLNVYEKDTTSNLIIWQVVEGGMAEGRAWNKFDNLILVNGTRVYNATVTLPPGTVSNDDLIVAYVPVRGIIKIILVYEETGSTAGESSVEFY